MALLHTNGSVSRYCVALGITLTALLMMDSNVASAQGPATWTDQAGIRIAGPYLLPSSSDAQSYPRDKRTVTNAPAEGIAREAIEPIEANQSDERMGPRLRGLQKSLSEIQFARSQAAERTPGNLASSVLAAETPIQVAMMAHSLAAPNRYPIAAQHNPLYFQEMNLERCGNTWGCAQTAVSAVDFFANVFILPYRVAERPWCRVECNRLDCQTCGRLPCMEPARLSCKGFALQAAAVVGIASLLF